MHACSSATAAERELYRYYNPEVAAVPFKKVGDAPRTSFDPVLTSFAQLGALRLNARRGIISLSGRTEEHIIAEAGQTISLQKEDDERDKLWHGVGTIKEDEGVGIELVQAFQDSRTAPQCIVIEDLFEHEQFKKKKIVSAFPCVRCLAAVPLRTAHRSTVIGTIVIVDDKPRKGLTEDEIEYLVDLSVTVMDYLEAGRTRQKHDRAERMVKALGLFVEGKSSLRDWWLQGGHSIHQTRIQRAAARGLRLVDRADYEFGVQDAPDVSSMQGIEKIRQSSLAYTPSSTVPSTYAHSEKDPHGTESVSESAANTTVETNGEIGDAEQGAAASDATSFNEVPSKLQEALVSPDVKDVFFRASNLIRESTSVHGVVFYDASVGSFGGRSGKGTGAIIEKAPGEFHLNGDNEGPISSSDDDQSRGKDEAHVNGEAADKTCNILGYSTRNRSSLRSHFPSDSLRSFPEKVIRRLLKKYPHGKVFNFDEDGSFSSSDSDGNTTGNENLQPPKPISAGRRMKKQMSKEQEAAAILAALPGARSVIWFPLWDQAKERWFSGSLVWSTQCTRVLCPMEDLTYMAAFGNSVMSEVSRIAALAAAQMKTDFISSISHELRSPLHGVLASVELLQETEMTDMQAEMVGNISSSGRVLLDTINHVLDFSKVNRKLKEKPRNFRRGGRLPKSQPRGNDDSPREGVEDIYRLSAEVMTSVYAGRNIGKLAQQVSVGRRPKMDRADTGQTPVIVIIDAPCRSDFMMEIDAGAWRRILMNLFSNALKYTSQGFVRVKFGLEELPAVQGHRIRHQLILRVIDSGSGISQEFLRHQLYKPFAQENSLAVGTGLGVSIVRQIVHDMGGDIQITSERGCGTEARVRLPVVIDRNSEVKNTSLSLHAEVRDKVRGLTARFFGFDRYPEISETPTGILSAESEAVLILKSSVKHTMREWFDITEAADPAIPDSQIALHIILESGFSDEALNQKISSFKEARAHATGRTLVMVLSNSLQKRKNMNSNGFTVSYVPQPFGPLRYAVAMHAGFVREFDESKQAAPGEENSKGLNGNSTPKDTEALDDLPPVPTFSVSPAPSTLPSTTELPQRSSNSASNGAKPSKVDAEPSVTEGMRVLLVEDNEINLKLLMTYMRKLKIDYTTATNGLEALEAYKEAKGQFDIVFMDISMPVMSGIESTRHIRTFEGEQSLSPVALIALTGAANPTARQEAFASGIDLFLTKPVPMKSLKRLLEDFRRKGKEDWKMD